MMASVTCREGWGEGVGGGGRLRWGRGGGKGDVPLFRHISLLPCSNTRIIFVLFVCSRRLSCILS